MDIFKKSATLIRRFSTREKFLLLAFCIVILMIWMDVMTTRLGDIRNRWHLVQSDLDEQAIWQSRAPEMMARLSEALAVVDPSRTFSASQLTGRLDNLARASRLPADIDPVVSREGQVFNNHRVRIRMNRVSTERLLRFSEALLAESPYITLDRMRLSANRTNPEELDVQLEISSFEVIQSPEILR